jgi:type IV secretory pathway VirB2 component (pilin)
MSVKGNIVLGMLLCLLIQSVKAADPGGIIADVLCMIGGEIEGLARNLAILIIIYAGAKYAYGSDDPGQRKASRNLAVNALIGYVIVLLSKALIEAIAGTTVC